MLLTTAEMLDTEGTPATADKPGNHDRATAAATVAIVGVLSTVLRIRIRDLGSGAFMTPGSGIGKESGSGSGTNNPDHISESLENNILG
jgi:hypothetical protein